MSPASRGHRAFRRASHGQSRDGRWCDARSQGHQQALSPRQWADDASRLWLWWYSLSTVASGRQWATKGTWKAWEGWCSRGRLLLARGPVLGLEGFTLLVQNVSFAVKKRFSCFVAFSFFRQLMAWFFPDRATRFLFSFRVFDKTPPRPSLPHILLVLVRVESLS